MSTSAHEPTHSDAAPYSPYEELAHAASHGLGALCAIAGLAVLVVLTESRGGAALAASLVYGVSLVLMYTASTAYHAVPFRMERLKRALQAADHCAIFLLIAGTYTPFVLIALWDASGISLLSAVWLLASIGIALRLLPRTRRGSAGARTTIQRSLHTGGPLLLYLAMGWLSIFALPKLTNTMALGGVVLLASGGLAYTLGVPFYTWRKLRYHHAIWHAFVLLGSALHYFAIVFYVIP